MPEKGIHLPALGGALHKVSYTFAGPLKHMVPPAADGNATPSPSSSRGGGRFDSMCHAPRRLASPGFTPEGHMILMKLYMLGM